MRIHPRSPRSAWFLLMIPFLVGGVLLSAPSLAGQKVNPHLFSRANMTPVDLKGLRVWMGKPVQITAQLGWQMSWDHGPGRDWEPTWAFIHLVPTMGKFANGNIIVQYALDPDTQDNPYFLNAYQISTDGGEHWGHRYSVLMTHTNMLMIPKPNNSLLGIPEMVQRTPGDTHNFVGAAYLFQHGGDSLLITPEAARVVDWPWEGGEAHYNPQPRQDWHAGAGNPIGSVLKVGNRLISTAQVHRNPTDKYGTDTIVSSEDGGYTWRYFSTLAPPDMSHAGQLGFEGADETSMIQLADGDLLAVYRTGNGGDWHENKSYSHDGGRTWSKPEAIPAVSVWPQLFRTANGTIMLTTGRPGLDMWLSTDGRGNSWQKIDLMAYHNKWAPDPSYRIGLFPITPAMAHYQAGTNQCETTAYTGIVEEGPNKLLVVYDRDPEQAPKNSKDLSRLFILPVEIERK